MSFVGTQATAVESKLLYRETYFILRVFTEKNYYRIGEKVKLLISLRENVLDGINYNKKFEKKKFLNTFPYSEYSLFTKVSERYDLSDVRFFLNGNELQPKSQIFYTENSCLISFTPAESGELHVTGRFSDKIFSGDAAHDFHFSKTILIHEK